MEGEDSEEFVYSGESSFFDRGSLFFLLASTRSRLQIIRVSGSLVDIMLQSTVHQDNILLQKCSAHKSPICPRELEAIGGSQPYLFFGLLREEFIMNV